MMTKMSTPGAEETIPGRGSNTPNNLVGGAINPHGFAESVRVGKKAIR